MKKLTIAVTLTLTCICTAAWAAIPEFGSKKGELACAGLVDLAHRGAAISKPPVPQVVTATLMAQSFYAGRLSKADPGATKGDIAQAMANLTLEEKNTYANICIKNAAALMQAQQQ